MKKTLIATEHPVPMEANTRRYITKSAAVEVTMSSYYARRILDGELMEVAPKTTKPKAEEK